MKKGLSIIGFLIACAGFVYSGLNIYGSTSKIAQSSSLKGNIKKLNEEKATKQKQLAEISKKEEVVKEKYEKMKKEGKICSVFLIKNYTIINCLNSLRYYTLCLHLAW